VGGRGGTSGGRVARAHRRIERPPDDDHRFVTQSPTGKIPKDNDEYLADDIWGTLVERESAAGASLQAAEDHADRC
jgi:hypothetical protein